MIEYGCARLSMEKKDDSREGEARLRSNLDLFLHNMYVKDFSPGCVCLKMSMSDLLSIAFFTTALLCLCGSVRYPMESSL